MYLNISTLLVTGRLILQMRRFRMQINYTVQTVVICFTEVNTFVVQMFIMKNSFQYCAIGLIFFMVACTKKENKIPKDLRQLIGFKDSHWIVDSIRQTGTTSGQNTPYSSSKINPLILEFHSGSSQVVIVKLDANGKSINRAPCGFTADDNRQEAQIFYSYTPPNRYDVIKSEKTSSTGA